MGIYEPAEDSYLLAEAVKKHAFGRVLDMGTGSGIQAETALKGSKATTIAASDINKQCSKHLNKRIKFYHSSLFSKIPKQKFDTIIFNPPYLPQDKGVDDAALYGGRKGYETTVEFLDTCSEYLSEDGIVLLLFSSLTKKAVIDEAIENTCLAKELISSKKLPMMETLYVYRIKKSELLQQLEGKKITNVKKLAKGNRGIIYTGMAGKKKIAIKAVSPASPVKTSIENEAKWLRVLNRFSIGPKLITAETGFFTYEFLDGDFIPEYIEKSSKPAIIKAFKEILQQCRKLDQLDINKLEMGRPHRHIIFTPEPVFIDFERCRISKNPKNVTQFCQYIAGKSMQQLLWQKSIKINTQKLIAAAKKYKKAHAQPEFEKLLAVIK